jgi:hypothetical protein
LAWSQCYQTGVLSASISLLEIGRSHRCQIRRFHRRRPADEVQCRRRPTAASGPGHQFGCDTVLAQFFRQNPLACPITNSHLLSNIVNGPTSILTEELLNSCNNFRSCAACGSPCVFVIN